MLVSLIGIVAIGAIRFFGSNSGLPMARAGDVINGGTGDCHYSEALSGRGDPFPFECTSAEGGVSITGGPGTGGAGGGSGDLD